MSDSDFNETKARALTLLTAREHTRGELEQKLQRREFSMTSIETVLDELQGEGWVDDARAAELYIRQRANKGYGVHSIQAGLRNKGVSSECIERCFAEADVDWVTVAQNVIERKFSSEDLGEKRQLHKAMRFMASRGFPAGLVNRLLRQLVEE
ncbi:MAG: regulatory protein RecX [Pseudomonadota bacterium]